MSNEQNPPKPTREMAALNQCSFLLGEIIKSEFKYHGNKVLPYSKESEAIFRKIYGNGGANITEAQYRMLLALNYKHKYDELEKMLDELR